MKALPANDRRHWASLLKRALERREKPTEAERLPARLTRSAGEPVTIVQRDLRAIRLVTQLSRDKNTATIEDVREAVAAIKSTSSSFAGGILRQLIRSVPEELWNDASLELFEAVHHVGTEHLYADGPEPLYLELAGRLSGPAKGAALAKALTSSQYRDRDECREMVATWEASHFDADVGRHVVSALLAKTAKRDRHEAITNLAAIIPLMGELYGPATVDATFNAFRDVTAWWP
jgi:hypothetical protein